MSPFLSEKGAPIIAPPHTHASRDSHFPWIRRTAVGPYVPPLVLIVALLSTYLEILPPRFSTYFILFATAFHVVACSVLHFRLRDLRPWFVIASGCLMGAAWGCIQGWAVMGGYAVYVGFGIAAAAKERLVESDYMESY